MPKLIDKDMLRSNILVQSQPFTPSSISMAAQVSSASAYVMIKELVGEGKVILDHKDGKRMFYAVVSGAGQTQLRTGKSILSLTPAERFEYVSNLVDMVQSGVSPSLLITGVAGIGKTFLVKKRFEAANMKEGHDFHFVQGHSSPMGLYKFLHDHSDSMIVFDDCDSVFKDEIAINILKSALDSYDVRKVSWCSAKMPDDLEPEFDFTGQVIFISNMDSCRIDEAVKSRTIVIDLQMSRKEICEYLWNLIGVIEPKMRMNEKEEVLTYLDEKRDCFEQFNIRTFIKACRIRRTADLKRADWRKMILVVN